MKGLSKLNYHQKSGPRNLLNKSDNINMSNSPISDVIIDSKLPTQNDKFDLVILI